jgi:hypothetical protein
LETCTLCTFASKVKMEHSLETRDIESGNLGERTRYSNAIYVNFSSDFL